MRFFSFFLAVFLCGGLGQAGLFGEDGKAGKYRFQLTGTGKLGNFTVLVDSISTNTSASNQKPSEDESLFFVSDDKGFLYSPLDANAKNFSIAKGEYRAQIVTGKRSLEIKFKVDAETPPVISLDIQSLMLASKEDKVRTLASVEARESGGFRGGSRDTITAAEARSIPGAGGDPLRAILSLPGIAPQSLGSQQFIVRGGGRNDILFFFDGIPIGDPFHDIGFYSVFPPSSVESVTFYPGAYPARFGRSQGAVVEILSKTSYDKTKLLFDLDANMAAAGAYLSIPLGKFFQLSIGARRTYYEFYIALINSIKVKELEPVQQLLTGSGTLPFFYDASVKLDFTPNEQHRISLLFSASQDKLTIDTTTVSNGSTGVSNTNAIKYVTVETWDSEAILYQYQGKNFQNNFSAARYFFTNEETFQDHRVDLSIAQNFTLRETFNWKLTEKIHWNAGVDYFYQQQPFSTEETPPGSNGGGFGAVFSGASVALNGRTNTYTAERHNLGVFTEFDFNFGPFTLTPGFRLGWSQAAGGPSNAERTWGSGFWDPDPRVSLTWKPSDKLEFFGRFGRYSQPAPLQDTTPGYGNPDLSSLFAYHYVLGGKAVFRPFELKVETYYKSLWNQGINNPTYDYYFPVGTSNQRFLGSGEGRAYGLEVFFRKQLTDGIFGWLSYSLSRAERYNYVTPTGYSTVASSNIFSNNGADYNGFSRAWQVFNQDVTHNVTMLASAEIVPKRIKLGARMSFSTGKPYTEKLVTTNSSVALILKDSTDILGARLPIKFGLDVRLDFMFKIFKNMDLSFYIDIWNLSYLWYKNTLFYNPSTNNLTREMIGQPAPQNQVMDVPIIPLIGVSLTF